MYTAISQTHLFYPLVSETFGPINGDGLAIISELGRRTFAITAGDPRETSFFYQSLSVAIQRFNAVCFTNSFDHAFVDTTSQP